MAVPVSPELQETEAALSSEIPEVAGSFGPILRFLLGSTQKERAGGRMASGMPGQIHAYGPKATGLWSALNDLYKTDPLRSKVLKYLLGHEKTVPISTLPGGKAGVSNYGGFYNPIKRTGPWVTVGEESAPSVLAEELGHAAEDLTGAAGKLTHGLEWVPGREAELARTGAYAAEELPSELWAKWMARSPEVNVKSPEDLSRMIDIMFGPELVP